MANMTNVSPSTTLVYDESLAMESEPKQTTMYSWSSTKWRQILVAFTSTAILVFFGCMSCIPIIEITEYSIFYTSLAFALTVMINSQIFGHVSVAHMNPAMTLAGVIWGNTSVALGICYAIVQIIGAVVGYGALIALTTTDMTWGLCVPYPHFRLTNIQALFIETILTGALSLLHCSVWHSANENKQDSVPIKFGLTMFGLSIIGGPLTGASMNPARALGPALWSGVVYNAFWIYWIGPLLGAGVTAMLYKFIFVKRDKYLQMSLL